MKIHFSQEEYEHIQGDAVILFLSKSTDLSSFPSNIQKAITLKNFKRKTGTVILFPSFDTLSADQIMIVGIARTFVENNTIHGFFSL